VEQDTWEPTKHGGFRCTGVAQGERRPNKAEAGVSKRPPVLIFKRRELLGLPECPYLIRWRLEFPFGSLRVHHWLGPDDDRAFHDHPWFFLTFVVRGGYTDRSPGQTPLSAYRNEHLRAPAIRFRPALHRHTVVPDPGGAWTVMLTGRRVRDWGFWAGGLKFVKANKWFASRGHHPCDSGR
jgi:hypothetical protein